MECCLEGNQCPLCSKSLLHDRHTMEDCLKDYVRQLMDTEQQAFPQNEVTWKIYEGDIEITWVWNKPSSGLQRCRCDRRRPLHYPKECLTISPVCHPCLFCGKEEPDHIPEDCPMKGDLSQAKMLQNCSISASGFSELFCIREFATYVRSQISPMAM